MTPPDEAPFPSFVERQLARLGVRPVVAALSATLAFGGLFVAALSADGQLMAMAADDGTEPPSTIVLFMLQMPFIAGALVFATPYLRGWLGRMLSALRPLVPEEDDAWAARLERVRRGHRATHGLTVAIYTGFSLAVLGGWDPAHPALSAYWLLSMGTVSVLIGRLLARVPLFAKALLDSILPAASAYNVFHPLPLHSVAHLGLRLSLVLVGLIVGGELFVSPEEATSAAHITTNATLVGVALGLHFLIVRRTHTFMFQAKERELGRIRASLHALYGELHVSLEDDGAVDALESPSAVLLGFEERLRSAPEWPQNSALVAQLAGATLLPMLVTLMRSLLGGVTGLE